MPVGFLVSWFSDQTLAPGKLSEAFVRCRFAGGGVGSGRVFIYPRARMSSAFRLAAALLIGPFAAAGAAPADGFVLVKGGTLRAGILLDDFEMATHPVTNVEYQAFIAATRHPAPPYWGNGRIPAGLEQHPVV